MKLNVFLIAILSILIVSCGKDSATPTPAPVDNGPLGGNYVFKSSTQVNYDTANDSGPGGVVIEVSNIYTSTSTSCTGTLAITNTNIKSTDFVMNYGTTRTSKSKNLNTGVTTNGSYAPTNDSRSFVGRSYNSNYTFSIAGSQMLINDAQYLFSPAFQLLPLSGKYNYTFTNNDLTITWEVYTISSGIKYRSTIVSVFTKI